MKKRNPRLDTTVREAVADLLETEFNDPRLRLVTITEVQVSQDAKEALVFYSTLDPDIVSADGRAQEGDRVHEPHEVAAALESARPRLQALIARRVKMRNTPVLRFEADPVRDHADRIEELLRQVRRDRD
jgi:ribosome-binding factor A